jgi:gentisate 1,2-dioxygenase
MATQLGTLKELGWDYVDKLAAQATVPLWPSLREILPYGRPINRTVPHLWRSKEVRRLLLQAGELTPIEQAERRVIVLANPGL